jgi:arylsulfatase A-like enzyme
MKMKKSERIKNIILITIDCLRADHLSCMGYPRETTPHLDKLAKTGILFEQAFSNGPGTQFSFPSILTSTYSLMYNYNLGGRLSEERVMISEILKKEGYSTAAFHWNPYLTRFFGYNRGFELFEDFVTNEKTFRRKENKIFDHIIKITKDKMYKRTLIYGFLEKSYEIFIGGRLSKRKWKFAYKWSNVAKADVINQKAISWLENKTNNKFFLWLHYMDVHSPYSSTNYLKIFRSEIPDKKEVNRANDTMYKYRSTYNKSISLPQSELELIVDLYDSEIRYVDEAIGNFMNELEKKNLLTNTLVVITADHGDEFLEHGSLAHNPKLYDELLHVPLIFYTPQIDKGIKCNDLCSLLDLSPTILDVLNIRKPKRWQGESLLSLIESKKRMNNGIISECISNNRRKTSYRSERWKFILDEEKDSLELYNLEEDSKELVNIADKNLDLVNTFKSKIAEHILMEKKMNEKARTEKETKKRIKNLKALGKI